MLQTSPRTRLAVRVADRQYGDTVFAQVAEWAGTEIVPSEPGYETTVILRVRVHLHALVNGQLGDRLPAGQGLSTYPVPLFADNTCAVYCNVDDPADPRNGEILAGQGARTTAEWDAFLGALPEPVKKQGDFFADLLELPVVINGLVRAEITRANEAPYYKFGGAPPLAA